VKFEIEKDLSTSGMNRTNNLWASVHKELLADFKQSYLVGQQGDVLVGLFLRRDIKRKNQSLFGCPQTGWGRRCTIHGSMAVWQCGSVAVWQYGSDVFTFRLCMRPKVKEEKSKVKR